MNQKHIFPFILSTLAGALAALAVSVAIFFAYKTNEFPEPPSIVKEEPAPTPVSRKTEVPMPPEAEVNESDVLSLNLDTTYRGFFDEDSKCRKTYGEMFDGKENDSDANSACSVNLTFNRDGSAEKKITIRRYDSAARDWREIEKSVWKSKISGGQFKELAKAIVGSEAFKSWSDRISITARNCKVTVKHTNGTKSPMSNIGESGSNHLSMVNAFKILDGKVRWEKIQ